MAAILAAPARPVLISFGRLVYEVRRVNSDDLRRVGYAVLEGESSVRAAEREIKDEARRARKLLRGLSGEAKTTEARRIEGELEEKEEKRLELMLESPQRQVALLERSAAYICAAIVGAGRLLDGVASPDLGTVIDAADPALVLEDLRSDAEIEAGKPPIYVEPIRYVQEEAEQDPDKGRIWVHALPEGERRILGGAVIVLQGVSREIRPFRLEPPAAPDAGQPVDEVSPPPARDPDARPSGPSAGHRSKGSRVSSPKRESKRV